MKVTIVHDYLNQRGGAERVVGALHVLFPEAEIHTLMHDEEATWPVLKSAQISTSFLQKIPFVVNNFKLFFWLYPFTIRMMKLPESDVVISSSSAFAKAVKLPPNRPLHICYCHTPMRFAWDFERYIENETRSRILKYLVKLLVPLLKMWDLATVDNVDLYIANSSIVQTRIRNWYKREAKVIYPPVEIEKSTNVEGQYNPDISCSYFLVVSRLVSYKGIDLAIMACTRMGYSLVVIGDGPDTQRLRSLAGPNVEFLGWQADDVVKRYMRSCLALIFPGEEDFGITPVEAHAQGRPVVAYRAGGALDTIVPGLNGVFFEHQTEQNLIDALEEARKTPWDCESIQKTSLRFSEATFSNHIVNFIESKLGKSSNIT